MRPPWYDRNDLAIFAMMHWWCNGFNIYSLAVFPSFYPLVFYCYTCFYCYVYYSFRKKINQKTICSLIREHIEPLHIDFDETLQIFRVAENIRHIFFIRIVHYEGMKTAFKVGGWKSIFWNISESIRRSKIFLFQIMFLKEKFIPLHSF